MIQEGLCLRFRSIELKGTDAIRVVFVEAVHVGQVARIGLNGWRHMFRPDVLNGLSFTGIGLMDDEESGSVHGGEGLLIGGNTVGVLRRRGRTSSEFCDA